MEASMPTDHARYSPSSYNYRAQCHGWENRNETSDAATEGELCHRALEIGYDDALDTEQAAAVGWVREQTKRLLTTMTEVHREVRLEINLPNHTDVFGTCDLFGVRNGEGWLIDYKFGRLAVPEPQSNLQVIAYVVGAFQRWPKLNVINAVLLLARRNELMAGTFHRDCLPTYVKLIDDLLTSVTEENPERRACKACEYCVHLADCPTAMTALVQVAHPSPLDVVSLADPKSLTPEVLDEVALPFARVAEKWAAAVKERAKQLLTDGVELAHHKLGERAAPTKLNGSVNDAWDHANGLVTLEEFLPCCSLSVSQLRKAVRDAHPKGKKDEAEQELVKRLRTADLIESAPEKQKYLQRK